MRIRVADLADLEGDGTRVRIRHGKFDILVANSDGKLYAIDNRCSHANMPMHGGRIRRGVVTCPSHLAQFNLADGSIKRGPMEGDPGNVHRLRTFQVRVDESEVFVDVPDD